MEAGHDLQRTERHVFSVSEVNRQVRMLLESARPSLWLAGEVADYRDFQRSGHWYFTLRDDDAQISAVMFRGRNRDVRFTPENGMEILVRGQLSLYEPRGTYQLIVSRMEPRGAGALALALEQVRKRLEMEGLFAVERKRSLPVLPQRVALVTSRDGAALRDMLRVLRRDAPGLSVVIVPSRVQGEGASAELASAIERAGRLPGVDALITGRGGGSLEDLWAFNEEEVVRAIVRSPVPVISGVGHETDWTLADLAADLRAATPTAAAALLATRHMQVSDTLSRVERRLAEAVRLRLERHRPAALPAFIARGTRLLGARIRARRERVDHLTVALTRGARRRLSGGRENAASLHRRLAPVSLLERVRSRRRLLEAALRDVGGALQRALMRRRQALAVSAGELSQLSPLTVLERGYALAQVERTGALLRHPDQVRAGDRLALKVRHGEVDAEVLQTRTTRDTHG